MEVVINNLADLKPTTKNTHQKEIQEYIKAIEILGQLRPIVIDEKKNIIVGNKIFFALFALKRKTCACLIVEGLTTEDKKKRMETEEKIFDFSEVNLSFCPRCGYKFRGNADIKTVRA